MHYANELLSTATAERRTMEEQHSASVVEMTAKQNELAEALANQVNAYCCFTAALLHCPCSSSDIIIFYNTVSKFYST